jgi:hypothetical protein
MAAVNENYPKYQVLPLYEFSHQKQNSTVKKICEVVKHKRPGRLTAGVRLLHNGA